MAQGFVRAGINPGLAGFGASEIGELRREAVDPGRRPKTHGYGHRERGNICEERI